MAADTTTIEMTKKAAKRAAPFKVCPNCRAEWTNREQWLCDPTLKLVGYQVNFNRLKAGILMFNHSCRTTLALPVESFADLYNGPIFDNCATGTDACGGHCLHEGDLRPCPAECECAFVRHILQLIQGWPKDTAKK